MGDRTKTMANSDILNPSDPEESELTPKQLSAIEHLMMGKNMQVSAAATGVDVRTLRRWMGQKAFSTEYDAARRAGLAVILAQVETAAGEATATQLRLMKSGDDAIQDRVSRGFLQMCQRNKDVFDLKKQVIDLEKTVRKQAAQIEKLKHEAEDNDDEIIVKYVDNHPSALSHRD
jgi:hypothetical protein